MSWPDIENYHKVFSEKPKCLIQDKGVLAGYWWEGNLYKRKIKYHGAYPPSYLKRVRALFPNPSKRILHLFSGTVLPRENEITIDLSMKVRAQIHDDAHCLSHIFEPNMFSLVIADPPYTKEDAEKYGFPLPNKRLILREAAVITEPGGFLVWLDLMVPIFRKIDWKLIGTIGYFCGTNRKTRTISLFERKKE